MAEHHLSACQHCQYIPSSPSHHLSLPLTTSQPRTVPVSTLNGTPASSRHFLSSHINNFKSPNPPATNSPDVHRPLLHHAVHHPMATRKDPKAEPTSRTHHCPSTQPATPAAIGQCTALPIPGREPCVSAGILAPTTTREKHQARCTLAAAPNRMAPSKRWLRSYRLGWRDCPCDGTTVLWGLQQVPAPVRRVGWRSCIRTASS